MDSKVILGTAFDREEITAIEALMLFQENDSINEQLFEVSDAFNQRLNNRTVTYVRSKAVHYTNVCRADCSFCSFYTKKGKKNAFALTPTEVLRQIRDTNGIKQINLQGGLNTELNLAYHVDLLNTIHDAYPKLHIHGYSPSEIHFLARRARTTPVDVLKRFQAAGLDSLSGDSADILNDKLRKKICPDKLRTADWIDITKTSHRLGIPTTATILFGHVEDEIYICEHLEILKNIQKETGGFVAFEPIAFVPNGTELARTAKIRSGPKVNQIKKMVAVSRIFFSRLIPNIQIDWTKTGLKTAMQACQAGANDIGPLSYDAYEIRLPEVNGRGSIPIPSLRSAIQKAGRVPSERQPYTLRAKAAKKMRRRELVFA